MQKFRKPNPKLDDKRTIENLKREVRSLERQLRELVADRDKLSIRITRISENETWRI